MRAVSYIRQSKKREDDSASSPEAQRTKCEALITAKGWDNAGHFADVGKSGWDPGVVRPAFEEMMAAVRAGHVDAVVVFSLSRLTRQGALEAMLINNELAKHGVLLVSVEEPYLDTSTPMGVAIFGLIAALAQQESDMKSAYITATKETLRAAGSHISGMSPFGFQSTREARGELVVVKLIPDPTEAPVVRDIVAWATDGVSASSIARKLNESGVPTKAADMIARVTARRARGKSDPLERTAWTSSTVLRILRNPHLAGYAAERKNGKRVILRDESGAPLVSHEPIIAADDWWRLQDVLDGRTPVVTKTARSVPSLLGGAGMLFCGVCGSVMVTDRRGGKIDLYRCNRAQSGAVPGHGGLAIDMGTTDDVVTRAVWSRLTAMDPEDPADVAWLDEAARRFAAQEDTSERLAELAAARAELEHVREALRTLYADRQAGLYSGDVGTAMFRESVERLTAHESRTAARVDELGTADAGTVAIPAEWVDPGEDPIGPGSPWANWALAERREFLAFFVDRVTVAKSIGRGRNANTEQRITVHWAEAPA
ncbi:recombinase family protein [Streptomyces sp. NBC_01724]|uniref:recombinase family protein n=1 Tax=Streptomyces sp. NBC_01724 TaxID=2975922 RepID=UPI002E2FF5C2|nr:recombinase family protein [Streptomyces sp. NBC_01724]